MLMRYYPSLGVGHMHVHTSENADCSQAIPRNFDLNGSEVNSMESEEADVDIAVAPITITGGKSDHLDSTDDEDRGGDDPDSELGDERWEDVDDVNEMYALHEMYDR